MTSTGTPILDPVAAQPCPSPIAVQISVAVGPGSSGMWLQTWKSLADLAATWPGCRGFSLVHDRDDRTQRSAISTWEDLASYHRFMRESGILWLLRALGSSGLSIEHLGVEAGPGEPLEGAGAPKETPTVPDA